MTGEFSDGVLRLLGKNPDLRQVCTRFRVPLKKIRAGKIAIYDLHMAEGKKKESLESFFCLLTDRHKASVRAVCIDLNGAYRSVLRENLPGAEVVHDRFHIIAALDEVRRSEWRAVNGEGKKVIKDSRFLSLVREHDAVTP